MKYSKMKDRIQPSWVKMGDPASCYSFFYFEWLLDRICDVSHPKERYRSLLETLFRVIIFQDANRESDGLDLRLQYNNLPRLARSKQIHPIDLNRPCSVLEVLIALCLRIEENILSDEVGNRTSIWFWTIMENMNLDHMDNNNFDWVYVNEAIDIFINRTYGPRGERGPFYIPYSVKDLRTVELWYQAMWYITANLT